MHRLKKYIIASLWVLLMLPVSAFAQQIMTSEVADALPEDVVQALEQRANVQTVYPVTGDETFTGQVLRADQIVFSKGATLTLESIDAPWVLIAANSIKFQDPGTYSRIEFRRPELPIPSKAKKGADGADATGRNGRHGRPGGHGQDGRTGMKGQTMQLPHLYVVAGSVESPEGVPPFVSLAVMGRGIDGGRGGVGGDGGNGGDGYRGKKAKSSLFDCKRGGGDGGDGGNAGRGGRGGAGGDGGDGVSVTMVSTQQGAEIMSYTRLLNVGGFGGRGGSPGNPGTPGEKGGMGRGEGHCGGGRSGSNGSIPDPDNLGRGPDGGEGSKGTFRIVSAPNLSPYVSLSKDQTESK